MSAQLGGRPFAWQVVLPKAAERAEVERCLVAGGFSLVPNSGVPLHAEIGTVTVAFTITATEQEVLNRLPFYDTAREIAAALFVATKTVHNHVRHLEEKLQVHARHRLVAAALESGLLTLATGAPGGNPSVAAGTRRAALRVMSADPQEREALERWLLTAGFPVLQRRGVPWETAPDPGGLIDLTGVELKALALLPSHDTSGQIAAALGVSVGSVDSLLQRLEGALGVRSHHRLVAVAAARGILRVGTGA